MLFKPAALAVGTFTVLLLVSAALDSLVPMLLGLLVLLRWIRFDPADVLNLSLWLCTRRFTIPKDKIPSWLLTFLQAIASLVFFSLVYLIFTLVFERRVTDFSVANFFLKAAVSGAISYYFLRAGASDLFQVWFTTLRRKPKF